MKKLNRDRSSERGGTGVKVVLVFVVLALAANAGINYIPVAYQGASFKQEMDTAVVKALGAGGRIQPMEVAHASMKRALAEYEIPADAFVEIKPVNGVVEIQVAYSRPVSMLPFGMYTHDYKFNHVARPVGYLTK